MSFPHSRQRPHRRTGTWAEGGWLVTLAKLTRWDPSRIRHQTFAQLFDILYRCFSFFFALNLMGRSNLLRQPWWVDRLGTQVKGDEGRFIKFNVTGDVCSNWSVQEDIGRGSVLHHFFG